MRGFTPIDSANAFAVMSLPRHCSTRSSHSARLVRMDTSGRRSIADSWAQLDTRFTERIRVGDYRVLYEIDDTARTVRIMRVRHRREVYR